MKSDIQLSASNLSKKFCTQLNSSMKYGIIDITKDFLGIPIKSKKLRKNEFWGVENVSFQVRQGECLGLIGPNGAGKSTILKLLSGIIKPDKGSIKACGRMGALIEVGAGFHPLLTGRENIYINGSIMGLSKKEIDAKFDSIVDFADLGDFIDTPVSFYSSGMYVRLGFAVAAHLEPDILLIDEVIAVGDTGFRMKCFQHILNLIENGTSIIFVTHLVEQLSRVTDQVVVMDKGKIVFNGDLNVGIGRYHNIVQKNNSNNSTASDAWIESVNLLNNGGFKQNEFMTGDSVIIEVALKAIKKIKNARVIIQIESPSIGLITALSTPFKKFQFDIHSEGTQIQLSLHNLPLLVGGYSVNIHLYGENITDFYDKKVPALNFQITGPTTNAFGYGINGRMLLEHDWIILN